METSMAAATTATIATMDAAAVIQPTPGGDMPRDERGWGEDSGGSGGCDDNNDDKNKGDGGGDGSLGTAEAKARRQRWQRWRRR
jgi:hypothetical protein